MRYPVLVPVLLALGLAGCPDLAPGTDRSDAAPPVDGACMPPTILCGPLCVDLTSDMNNCGQCNLRCAVGMACVSGRCACVGPTCPGAPLDGGCAPPLTMCAAVCTSVMTDPMNCGRCGNACASLATCTSGVCQ